jgi:hypothetical protein
MWSQLFTQKEVLYETTCPLVLSLKVKEQLEGVTAIWCTFGSFLGCFCGRLLRSPYLPGKQLDPD